MGLIQRVRFDNVTALAIAFKQASEQSGNLAIFVNIYVLG